MATEKRTPIVGQGPEGGRPPPGIGRGWTQRAPGRREEAPPTPPRVRDTENRLQGTAERQAR
ncbi:MAG TPA: hypothetical protein VNX21_00395, partial [Candidatus Thermoplasmatota archaeon]|nr:hypothetical protein [Candidatus Thermoplasmatota archaeon]